MTYAARHGLRPAGYCEVLRGSAALPRSSCDITPVEWPIHVADPSIDERVYPFFDEMSAGSERCR